MRARHRERFHVPAWVRWGVYTAGSSCALSGASWLLLHHVVRVEGDFGPVASPFEHPALVLHGVVAAVLVWLFGVLWLTHIRRAWQRGTQRALGGTTVVLMTWLSLSGMGLYYLADERWRAVASVGHWGVGLLAAAWLPLHIWRGRRALNQQFHREEQ